jgi:hypothetical protein
MSVAAVDGRDLPSTASRSFVTHDKSSKKRPLRT